MKVVGIAEAKTNLARLIDRACMGEEVVIARGVTIRGVDTRGKIRRGNDRAVRLVPIKRRRGRRKLGILKGKLVVGPEFFEPLPPEELAGWS